MPPTRPPRPPLPAPALRAGRLAALALVAAVLLSGCARAGGEPFQPTHNTPVAVDDRGGVAQTVNPAGDAVSAVDVVTATFDAPADPGGELVVLLRDPADGRVLASTRVPGEEVGDGTWVRAGFGEAVAVPDVVVVELAWEGSTPLALWANRPLDPEDPDIPANDPYPAGELLLDGRPAQGDLAFRVEGAGGAGAAAAQAAEVVRSAGGRLLDQPVFAAVWLLLVAGSAVLATAGLGAAGLGAAGRRRRR